MKQISVIQVVISAAIAGLQSLAMSGGIEVGAVLYSRRLGNGPDAHELQIRMGNSGNYVVGIAHGDDSAVFSQVASPAERLHDAALVVSDIIAAVSVDASSIRPNAAANWFVAAMPAAFTRC